ncbi:hypothetical protein D3C86_903510 [compost metagenome]
MGAVAVAVLEGVGGVAGAEGGVAVHLVQVEGGSFRGGRRSGGELGVVLGEVRGDLRDVGGEIRVLRVHSGIHHGDGHAFAGRYGLGGGGEARAVPGGVHVDAAGAAQVPQVLARRFGRLVGQGAAQVVGLGVLEGCIPAQEGAQGCRVALDRPALRVGQDGVHPLDAVGVPQGLAIAQARLGLELDDDLTCDLRACRARGVGRGTQKGLATGEGQGEGECCGPMAGSQGHEGLLRADPNKPSVPRTPDPMRWIRLGLCTLRRGSCFG